MVLSPQQKETLHQAEEALRKRVFYAAYPEHPKAYDQEGDARAQEWLAASLGKPYGELIIKSDTTVGNEASPFTQEPLGIQYPSFTAEELVLKASRVLNDWRYTPVDSRAAVLLSSLERVSKRFFDIAYATMHTSGQSFMMAFQASGPHALDRALEAITLGYKELLSLPHTAEWEKDMGKMSIKVKKTWQPMGRGISLAIGCSTFPVWNSLPGIYASLITGNPVIVKPHPGAILPIAIVVAEIQRALLNAGLPAEIVQLAPDSADKPIAKLLAEADDVKIIDYTGGNDFGDYLEKQEGKIVFTEKAGVNSVILDSCDDLKPVVQNLAFSLSLYSGQMCTAPQNFFIPAKGIRVGGQYMSFDDVAQALKEAVVGLVQHPKMGAGTLGAIQSVNTYQRADGISKLGGKVILEQQEVTNLEFPGARIHTPVLVELDADDYDTFSKELFGPIALLIKTETTDHSLELASNLAREKGAISSALYSVDDDVKHKAMRIMEQSFTPLSINLTGPLWMNQNAAFSDFHVTGGNPAGNATFTDTAYVVRRFVWVGHKEMIS